jgi:hypothetical protein
LISVSHHPLCCQGRISLTISHRTNRTRHNHVVVFSGAATTVRSLLRSSTGPPSGKKKVPYLHAESNLLWLSCC